MTTIAYRDGVLAADSLVTAQGIREGAMTKIAKVGRVLAAGCGNGVRIRAFLDWVRGGMKGAPPAMGDNSEAVILAPGHPVVYVGSDGLMTQEGCEFYALGSGSRIAYGALAAGASAEEAVRIAARYDTSTGGEVVVLRRD
jgi:ATP-dependent HslUV protease subunit HslV